MSLLMDALRKAEQAKQDVAVERSHAQAKESGAAPSGELQLETAEPLPLTMDEPPRDDGSRLSPALETPSHDEVQIAGDTLPPSSGMGIVEENTTIPLKDDHGGGRHTPSAAMQSPEPQAHDRTAAPAGEGREKARHILSAKQRNSTSRHRKWLGLGATLVALGTLGAIYHVMTRMPESSGNSLMLLAPQPTGTPPLAKVREPAAAAHEAAPARPSPALPPEPRARPSPPHAPKHVAKRDKPRQAAIAASARPAPHVTPRNNTEAAAAPIHILRGQKVDALHGLLVESYQAYRAGNDSHAKEGYRRALERAPANRDALLGLAAIAQRQEHFTEARFYYRRLLELNPKDSLAMAGMISLQGGYATQENESRLKLLLDQEPDAAYLYFTLGNQYAAQTRWADAQQAFFQAFRYDRDNADYAYNVAISLDQLKQGQAALPYYRQALELARGNMVGFDTASVMRRIDTLNGTQGEGK